MGSDYDPMLAKVIVWAPDRDEALRGLHAALGDTVLLGLDTNIGFLRALLADPDVRAGRLDTGLVGRRIDALAAADAAARRPAGRGRARAGRAGAQRPGGGPVRRARRLAGRRARLDDVADGAWPGATRSRSAPAAGPPTRWSRCGRPSRCATRPPPRRRPRSGRNAPACEATAAGAGGGRLDGDRLRVTSTASRRTYAVALDGDTLWLGRDGHAWAVHEQGPVDAVAAETTGAGGPVRSPMPGTVTVVEVAEGQAVTAGDRLVVVEAMKMEHVLTAPVDGVVRDLRAKAGATVAKDAVLLTVTTPRSSRWT